MKKLITVFVFTAQLVHSSVGVNSGLTSLFVSGNEILVTNATSNSIKSFKFSPPSTLAPTGTMATDRSPIFISVSSPYAYVLNRESKTLQTFMIEDEFLLPLGSAVTGFDPSAGFFRSPYIFVTSSGSNALEAFSVSCNNQPTLASRIQTGSVPTSVNLDGKYAFVTCFGNNNNNVTGNNQGLFQSFDVGKLRWGISLTGSVETEVGPVASFVSSPNAYVVNFIANKLQSFDISNPAAMAKLASVETDAGPTAIDGDGNLLFVICRLANVLDIFDVSNPREPRLLHRVVVDYGPAAVKAQSPYVYVACSQSLQVIDISDPLRKPPMVVASIFVN